jgi:hypothetical protein
MPSLLLATKATVCPSVYVHEYRLSTCAVCAAGQDCTVCVQYADSVSVWTYGGAYREPLLK